jgi:hypothetical protein
VVQQHTTFDTRIEAARLLDCRQILSLSRHAAWWLAPQLTLQGLYVSQMSVVHCSLCCTVSVASSVRMWLACSEKLCTSIVTSVDRLVCGSIALYAVYVPCSPGGLKVYGVCRVWQTLLLHMTQCTMLAVQQAEQRQP